LIHSKLRNLFNFAKVITGLAANAVENAERHHLDHICVSFLCVELSITIALQFANFSCDML